MWGVDISTHGGKTVNRLGAKGILLLLCSGFILVDGRLVSRTFLSTIRGEHFCRIIFIPSSNRLCSSHRKLRQTTIFFHEIVNGFSTESTQTVKIIMLNLKSNSPIKRV